ncbi:hypothetical protein V499_07930 [Pseudogymnoascus sp. VKM F-103]|nr:hypothetical protein V499_07930 [Pseudogymnoascus sp. VKM F-103]
MLHLPHVLRLFMHHPHHTPDSDVLSGSEELCAESVEMKREQEKHCCASEQTAAVGADFYGFADEGAEKGCKGGVDAATVEQYDLEGCLDLRTYKLWAARQNGDTCKGYSPQDERGWRRFDKSQQLEARPTCWQRSPWRGSFGLEAQKHGAAREGPKRGKAWE